jgi:RimJ/RimL family protein N-acetyltransferase
MQLNKVLREFYAINGQKVILRTPRPGDLSDLLDLINSLVKEGAEISRTEKVTMEEESEWLSKMLSDLEKSKLFFLVAEVDGKTIASSDIHIVGGYAKHVGVLGIVIKNGFRGIGIGSEMIRTLIEQSRDLGLAVLNLTVFATNKRAIHVYENMGFIETGKIPKKHFKEGQYVDEIIMTKLIE